MWKRSVMTLSNPTINVTPSGQSCGAHVRGVDLGEPLTPDVVAEIRAAWMQHKVLAFPDQQITDDALEQYALQFGPFGIDPFFESIDGHPQIAAIHRRADETASVFAESWHADWTFQETPPDGTYLYGKVIPPVGGNTFFANQEAALASIPPELRAKLEGLTAIHSARTAYAPDGVYGESDAEARAMKIVVSDEAYETRTHLLIRTHPETGAQTFYSSLGYIVGIEGMAEDTSTELLLVLYGYQTAESVVYEHQWEANMLVMWDNRCVLHKASAGYDGHERLLHRITIGPRG